MGLDMYLYRTDRIDNFDEIKNTNQFNYWDFDEIGYWRKAYAIDRWFVQNKQHGVNDCLIHDEVTEDDLIELIKWCIEQIEDKKDDLKSKNICYDCCQDYTRTICICAQALTHTDFETEMLFYVNSY